MRIDILSLFPEMFSGPFSESITKRAIDNGILDIEITDPRDFAFSKHRQVDDSPFGGGSGMVLKPEPFFRAVDYIRAVTDYKSRRVLLMCPSGKTFNQAKAKELARYEQLIIICGHYEGFDARITNELADEVISIGDFVLTGGELPAMIITDAVSRMLPNVLGSEESAITDSFYEDILEYPQYTRPRQYRGHIVPEVLFSGDHAKIRQWRRQKALQITVKNRPDLIVREKLSKEDVKFLDTIDNSNE